MDRRRFVETLVAGLAIVTPGVGSRGTTHAEDGAAPSPRCTVVGVGGGGTNVVSAIGKSFPPDALNLLLVDTAAVSRAQESALGERFDCRAAVVQLSESLLGAGGDMDEGWRAAAQSRDKLEQTLRGSELVVIVAGLGGGTGGGASPVIASVARHLGVPCIVIAITPFQFEGLERACNARRALRSIRRQADATAVFPNCDLHPLCSSHDPPMEEIFRAADDRIARFISKIREMQKTQPWELRGVLLALCKAQSVGRLG